jgi:hypothetical protein
MRKRDLAILVLLPALAPPLGAPAVAASAPAVALPALAAEPMAGLDGGEGPGFLRKHARLAAAGAVGLVVWQQRAMNPGEGESYRILGRWLRNGRPEGPLVILTAPGADSFWHPAPTLSHGGLAVVVWTRRRPAEPDRVEGAVGRIGGSWRSFAVDSSSLDSPRRPEVAALSDDAFVVVWRGVARSGRLGLDGQLFQRSGSGFLAGEPFAIGEPTDLPRPWAAVAAGPGGFEVVWGGRRAPDDAMLWARRFAASGAAVGPARALGRLGRPESAAAVLPLASLGYAVAWVEATPEGGTVWLRSLSAAGEAPGPAQRVADSRYPVFDGPLLAADGAGRLLVVWTARSAGGEEIHVHGVLWDQREDLPIAPPFSFGTPVTGNTIWPALAGGAGSLLLVWNGGPGLAGRTLTYRPDGSQPLAAPAVDCARDSAIEAALQLDAAMAGRGSGPLLLLPLSSRGGWTAEAAPPRAVEGGPSEPLRAEIPASKAGACAGGPGEEDRARIEWLAGRLALRGEPLPFALAVYRGEGVATFRVGAFYRDAPGAPPATHEFEVSFDLLDATPGERRGLLRFVGVQTPDGAVTSGQPLPDLDVEMIGAKPIDGRGWACVGNVPEGSKVDSPCPSKRTFSISTTGETTGQLR